MNMKISSKDKVQKGHRLQRKLASESFWQIPLHFEGTGPIPSSLKLFEAGHTPVSTTQRKKVEVAEKDPTSMITRPQSGTRETNGKII